MVYVFFYLLVFFEFQRLNPSFGITYAGCCANFSPGALDIEDYLHSRPPDFRQ